ncbi:hypothetical protein O6H91_13G070400 [Diphasiastrum complanatum]|uniref:Uncharacterized protein n=4 Tax=Diphasiastrum complanatum TaxID=34168 RepID=A0ACC2BVU4_DIPCM|nr:hypothetical protein O6H91_13G034200 [Diphasiastrum complanatum]KAJ7533126.1 hypothetical protein O6H91_13G034300 [Diphasiastrum complanatum]KAJ7533910.1 hypothetical protein O6H91_13G070300 [Diphasiastrum complanatum]KAJ7533911.1 hypothetical protein O6H91_13G070400 [Diphasiastrum complanatum]
MSHLPSARIIVSAVVGSFAISYVYFDLVRNKKIFGGIVPMTTTTEWWKETFRKFDMGWPREASEDPVVMNPIRRRNYRVVDKEF